MDAWDVKPFEDRKANQLANFIIFCEDGVCEPTYFRQFDNGKIKVNVVPNQNTKIFNVTNAITHCVNHGLIDASVQLASLISDDNHIWCVFDHDNPKNDNTSHCNVNFNAAIELAHQKGLKVAWSNDAFELWILLHFEEVDVGQARANERDFYYERLTEVFKSIENPNDPLKRVLSFANFNYKDSLKNLKRFRDIVNHYMRGRTGLAVKRAKRLNQSFEKGTAYHLKSPCTNVFELVEDLLSFDSLGRGSL